MTAKCHICRGLLLVTSLVGCLLGLLSTAEAQRISHPLYHSDLPPGVLGAMQIGAGRAQGGYVQPVQIQVPAGATVSVADQSGFQYESTDLRVGLRVGQPYRLRIANIPQHEDQSLYPSIELIDHLHPPEGQRDRFPVPIEITQEDLRVALSGSLVVRVIYVEDPARAFPGATSTEQLSTDVLASEDPLRVADEMGRPVAIMRLGSRIPNHDQLDADFVFGGPPVELLANTPPQELSTEPWEQEPAPIMMKTPLSTRARRGRDPLAPVAPLAPQQSTETSKGTSNAENLPSNDFDIFEADAEPKVEPTPESADETDVQPATPGEKPEAEAPANDPFDVGNDLEPADDPFLDDETH